MGFLSTGHRVGTVSGALGCGLRVGGYLIGIIVLAGVAAGYWFLNPDLLASRVQAADPLLVVGDANGLTDSLLLVYPHAGNRAIRALTIPRDTSVGDGHKINSVKKQGGIKALLARVGQLVGHPVSRYIVVPMGRFAAFVDYAWPNGVRVVVPYRMSYTDHAQGLHYDIAAGSQVLHGSQCLWFVRDRSDHRGDLGRTQRQALFLRTAARELMAPGQWLRLPNIARRAQQVFPTNVSSADLIQLVSIYRAAGHMGVVCIPGRPRYVNGVSFFDADRVAARSLAAQLRRGVVVPERLYVAVTNACGRQGVARDAARLLYKRMGLPIRNVGNGRALNADRTVVRYAPLSLGPLAEEVCRALGVQTHTTCDDPAGDSPRLVVEIGSDYERIETDEPGEGR